MNYDKQVVIEGLKRTIEQNEEKIIEYSKPCDARKRRIRALERDLLKKKNKELRKKWRSWKMKYKVTEYHSDFQEEQTGTCELCFGTAWVENGSITVEDENGTETEIYLTVWDWGDYDTIYIDNVVNFSAWLQEREVDPIIEETEPWSWLHELVEKYNEELEDDGRFKAKS